MKHTDPVAEVFRQGGDFYDMLEAQRKERDMEMLVCEYDECGQPYVPTHWRQKYCSRRCQVAAGRKRAAARIGASRSRLRGLSADERRRELARGYRVGSWGLTRDPFENGRFAMGLPGGHAMITPLEGMYSQPEPATEEAGVKEAA